MSTWQAILHPLKALDRAITEVQTCPGCGCNGDRWRDDCDCLRQGCSCAGAEQDDTPDWEREPGPDALIPDAGGTYDLPPSAEPRTPSPGYAHVDDTDDEETRQLKQAQNQALFLRRTATTDDERYAAEQAQDTYVGWLSDAVDLAFAKRDRLWAAAGYDDPAAAQQEERAVRLLDQYNAVVGEQMGEVERRRDENLARYERDEQWMGERDAARPPLPLPPAAQPYTPPKRTPTTGSTGGAGMSNIEEARGSIMSAHRSGESGLAELASAHASLEDAQNGLRNGTQGSNQAEADQAHAQLASAMDKVEEARGQVAAALAEFEGVAQRL